MAIFPSTDNLNGMGKLNEAERIRIAEAEAQAEAEALLLELDFDAEPEIKPLPETKKQDDRQKFEQEAIKLKNYEIVYVPVADIKTNTKEYQQRTAEFAEKTVYNIINKFDPNKFDPIVIYRHPNGNIYVLSGHSRLEGFRQAGRTEIPARFYQGTPEQAKEFALLSNKLGTPQTLIEDSNYYRDLRKRTNATCSMLDKEAKKNKDPRKLVNISMLSQNGKTFQALKSFESSDDIKGKAEVESIADMIGDARCRFPELSNAHEDELFDYLIDKNIKITKGELLQKLNDKINGFDVFEADKPLNLRRVKYLNPLESEWLEKYNEIIGRLDEVKRMFQVDKQTGWTELKKQMIMSIAPGNKPEQIDFALKKFESPEAQELYNKKIVELKLDKKAIEDELAKHMLQKDIVKNEIKNQQSLFGIDKPVKVGIVKSRTFPLYAVIITESGKRYKFSKGNQIIGGDIDEYLKLALSWYNIVRYKKRFFKLYEGEIENNPILNVESLTINSL
jgi:hypothetical protein